MENDESRGCFPRHPRPRSEASGRHHLQALRGVQWDIVRLGRSDADPLGPVADDGEEVACFHAMVSDDDCPDTHTGVKRKRSSLPRVLRVPIIRASGSWTGA